MVLLTVITQYHSTLYGAGESVNVDHFDVFHLDDDRLEVIVDEDTTELISSMTLSANRKEFRTTSDEARDMIAGWGTDYKQYLIEVTHNPSDANWIGVAQLLINATRTKPSNKNLYFTGALDTGAANSAEWCRVNVIGTREFKFNIEAAPFASTATAKVYGVNYKVRQRYVIMLRLITDKRLKSLVKEEIRNAPLLRCCT